MAVRASPWLSNCLVAAAAAAAAGGGAVSVLGEGMPFIQVGPDGMASLAPTRVTGIVRPTAHAVSSDGRLLVVSDRRSVSLYAVEGAVCLFSRTVYFMPCSVGIWVSRDDTSYIVIAVAGMPGLDLWPLSIDGSSAQPAGTPVRVQPDYHISHVTFSSSGAHMALVTLEGHVGIWSTAFMAARADQAPPAAHTAVLSSGRITSISFCPDGALVAILTWDGAFRLLQAVGAVWRDITFPEVALVAATPFNSDGPPPQIAWTTAGDALIVWARGMPWRMVDIATRTLRPFSAPALDAVVGLAVMQSSIVAVTRDGRIHAFSTPSL